MSKKQMVLAYAILLELGTIIPQVKAYANIGFILINIFSILMDRNKIGISLMSTFLLGGEVFPIINFFAVILVGRGNIGIKIPQFKFVALALVVVVFSLINSLFYDTTTGCIFYICYLLLLFVCAAYCRNRVPEEDIIYSIKHFIVIQFIIVLTIACIEKTLDPGDIFVGSLENAHWFGNWVLVNILAFYYINKSKYSLHWKTALRKDWKLYLMALVEIYLADAKTLVVSMLVGIMIYKMSERLINKRNSFFYCFILFFLFLFVFSVIFQSDYVENFINGIVPGLAIYLYSDDFNGKILYITGTFANELSGYRLFTGFGLGQYGSRIATMFAYDQVWRAENFVNNFVAQTFAPAYIIIMNLLIALDGKVLY